MKKKITTHQNLNPLIEKYQSEKRWVNYRTLKVQNRITKIPFSPITKRKASSTDPRDWGTYEEALSVNKAAVGIVFDQSQILLGIDIDHCLQINTNIIEHEHKQEIAQLIIESDTYTEISPSGTGLHLYLSLTAPLSLDANRHGSFECYTSGRYFTFTAVSYKEALPVRTVTPEEALQLLAIIGYPWGKAPSLPDPVLMDNKNISSDANAIDLNDLLKKMFASKNGEQIKFIYDGMATATIYKNDASSADMALLSHLAFWTQKNPAQMESLWLLSPLGQREKTQKRTDYRARSIKTAIAHCKQVYENKDAKFKSELEESAPALELVYSFDNKGNKTYPQNLENISRILMHHNNFSGRLKYDSFRNILEMKIHEKWHQLEDHHILETQASISLLFPMFAKVSKELIYDAVTRVCRENTTDSAIDYIRSLVWDDTPRLSTWLSKTYHTPDDIYYAAVGANWMKGLIKRIIEPGCKFDYVLVLEGEQGIKKSTSLNIIGTVYEDQPSWHVETTMSMDSKDFFMQFQGKAIIEFSEGETLSRTEVKKMKAIITTQSDKYRPAYGRNSVDFPRRCVFAMTTNQEEYLKDETGNRRWLPVACVGDADVGWLRENRDQLFAEAYHRLTILKESIWDFPQEETQKMQEERRIKSPWTEQIADWYVNKLTFTDKDAGITTYQVYRDAICGGMVNKPITKGVQMEITGILDTYIRLRKKRTMIEGVQAIRWYSTDETIKEAESLPLTELDKF